MVTKDVHRPRRRRRRRGWIQPGARTSHQVDDLPRRARCLGERAGRGPAEADRKACSARTRAVRRGGACAGRLRGRTPPKSKCWARRRRADANRDQPRNAGNEHQTGFALDLPAARAHRALRHRVPRAGGVDRGVCAGLRRRRFTEIVSSKIVAGGTRRRRQSVRASNTSTASRTWRRARSSTRNTVCWASSASSKRGTYSGRAGRCRVTHRVLLARPGVWASSRAPKTSSHSSANCSANVRGSAAALRRQLRWLDAYLPSLMNVPSWTFDECVDRLRRAHERTDLADDLDPEAEASRARWPSVKRGCRRYSCSGSRCRSVPSTRTIWATVATRPASIFCSRRGDHAGGQPAPACGSKSRAVGARIDPTAFGPPPHVRLRHAAGWWAGDRGGAPDRTDPRPRKRPRSHALPARSQPTYPLGLRAGALDDSDRIRSHCSLRTHMRRLKENVMPPRPRNTLTVVVALAPRPRGARDGACRPVPHDGHLRRHDVLRPRFSGIHGHGVDTGALRDTRSPSPVAPAPRSRVVGVCDVGGPLLSSDGRNRPSAGAISPSSAWSTRTAAGREPSHRTYAGPPGPIEAGGYELCVVSEIVGHPFTGDDRPGTPGALAIFPCPSTCA